MFQAMKWARAECLRRKKVITKQNLKEILDPILILIRFPAMDIKDFTTFVGQSFFLVTSSFYNGNYFSERAIVLQKEGA
jgi:hypothetical protein